MQQIEQRFMSMVLGELAASRIKFPESEGKIAAMAEEVGELAKAMAEQSTQRVWEEAVQVASLALRIALEGDSSLDGVRARRGAEPFRVSLMPILEDARAGPIPLGRDISPLESFDFYCQECGRMENDCECPSPDLHIFAPQFGGNSNLPKFKNPPPPPLPKERRLISVRVVSASDSDDGPPDRAEGVSL